MATWDAFYADVLPRVPVGTPNPTVDRALMRVSQDFFRRTRAWRDMLAVTTVETQASYPLPLPAGAKLVRLESAVMDDQRVPVWRAGDRDVYGTFVFTPDMLSINFALDGTLPSTGQKLIADVTLMPAEGATGIPDALFEQYGEFIADGVAGRMGDPEAARRFVLACDHVNYLVWTGNAATRPRVRGFFF